MNSPASVFSVRNLEVGFGNGESVLRALDWELAEGELCAVVGPGGAGKTTFLKSLMGLLPRRAGEVFYRGQVRDQISRLSFLRDVAMTFQKSGLFDSMSCLGNLEFSLRELRGIRGREAARLGRRALEEVGLGGQEKLEVSQMSGGMQKRLGIARALIQNPKVVLYDDPTAGLDPITAHSILNLIRDMHGQYEITGVVVTSELHAARKLCPRVAYLADGHFRADGSWRAVEGVEKLAPFFRAGQILAARESS